MTGAKFIFFDTETTGLPKNYKAPYSVLDSWPRMIQLAVMVYTVNQEGKPVLMDESEFLIKPDGWEVPKAKFWIDNGFTQEHNLANGVPVLEAMEYFIKWVNDADYLVAHNMFFDQSIMGSEMHRAGLKADKKLVKLCTMQIGTPLCHLPAKNGGKGLKWPSLKELHMMLFGEDFEGAHNAEKDIQATARCFWAMVERGFIKL